MRGPRSAREQVRGADPGDRERDRDLDRSAGQVHEPGRAEAERQRVREREGRDDLRDRPRAPRRDHEPEEEQDVVEPGEDVLDPVEEEREPGAGLRKRGDAAVRGPPPERDPAGEHVRDLVGAVPDPRVSPVRRVVLAEERIVDREFADRLARLRGEPHAEAPRARLARRGGGPRLRPRAVAAPRSRRRGSSARRARRLRRRGPAGRRARVIRPSGTPKSM